MNLWLIETKNGTDNEKKISVAALSRFSNDVTFLSSNFAILRLPKFISRVQRVLIFQNLILNNISQALIFVNLTKNVEAAKTQEHQHH